MDSAYQRSQRLRNGLGNWRLVQYADLRLLSRVGAVVEVAARGQAPAGQARIGRSSGGRLEAEGLCAVTGWQAHPPRMGTSGSYVSWGVLQISVTNLVIILLMLAIFALAVLVPFGHRDRTNRR